MALPGHIVNFLFRKRREAIDRMREFPIEVQAEQLRYLLAMGAETTFGKAHGMGGIRTIEQFQRAVDIYDYETFSSLIKRTIAGEQGLIWPTGIRWFAKSSGTTGDKSKFIPVSEEVLQDSHFQGPRDVIAVFASLFPDSEVFSGKTLTLGGSRKIVDEGSGALTGDLSAILIENTPAWAQWRRLPSLEVALLPDFEEKVARICDEAVGENVTAFAGVPSWNLVMMNKILEYTGKDNLLEVWPNMGLFIHGGMNFKPYAEQYRRLIPSADMQYMETYNASEGFFALNDEPGRDDMLLMLDYHIFYEFLALDDLDSPAKAVPLEGVRTGVNYAMLITTSGGLWRYRIGDVVEFTSTAPYRIRIAGRTRHYINAFGEEVVVDNAEQAVARACAATGAEIADYSVAPVFMDGRTKGAHQWVIEFRRPPDDLGKFAQVLDEALQSVNSDYEAKRFRDTTLRSPVIEVVREGTFMRWMTLQGKVGGQNKVPRLFNDRTFVEQLLEIR